MTRLDWPVASIADPEAVLAEDLGDLDDAAAGPGAEVADDGVGLVELDAVAGVEGLVSELGIHLDDVLRISQRDAGEAALGGAEVGAMRLAGEVSFW